MGRPLRAWVGSLRWAYARRRRRGCPGVTNLLKGGHSCCQSSDLGRKISDQAFQTGNLCPERLCLRATWGEHGSKARLGCRLRSKGVAPPPSPGGQLCRQRGAIRQLGRKNCCRQGGRIHRRGGQHYRLGGMHYTLGGWHSWLCGRHHWRGGLAHWLCGVLCSLW